ncbi:hypothetical protein [Streptomyces lasiicapitis]|uniref:Uncharacterized protein n=1 Tax=Streptomyces lasiicapitis TaxID=1923961 RepID=A0ABQ2MVJ3_9ACTN|nr:hypothetical protein [Streptomyces lasiicapitis]GGO58907.1 hypothetical protein GCM10012286_79290 [Streptomyces lasiicapitis]
MDASKALGVALGTLVSPATLATLTTAGRLYIQRAEEKAKRAQAPLSSQVAVAAMLSDLSDRVLVAAVAADRAQGASWADIGTTLGITRSAAHARFVEPVEKLNKQAMQDESDQASPSSAVTRLKFIWSEIEELAVQEQTRAAAELVTQNPQLPHDLQAAEALYRDTAGAEAAAGLSGLAQIGRHAGDLKTADGRHQRTSDTSPNLHPPPGTAEGPTAQDELASRMDRLENTVNLLLERLTPQQE